METYLLTIAIICFLSVTWVLIQRLWGAVFSDEMTDPDVLAGRSDCGSCGCDTPCSVKKLKMHQKIK